MISEPESSDIPSTMRDEQCRLLSKLSDLLGVQLLYNEARIWLSELEGSYQSWKADTVFCKGMLITEAAVHSMPKDGFKSQMEE